MDAEARQVAQAFHETQVAHNWHRLGNAGGFSGAYLWRIESAFGDFCLKAWPPAYGPRDLVIIHRLMRQATAAQLPFVPRLATTLSGHSWVEKAERCWDLQSWLPGRADFHDRPSNPRLATALTALAQLHLAWRPAEQTCAPAGAVLRRLTALTQWDREQFALLTQHVLRIGADPAATVARQALELLRRWLRQARLALEPWASRSFPLQPCLCDIWHDHVLFDGDRVMGIVDYGGIRERETVSADLARLLGSLVGDDPLKYKHSLPAYETVRPLTAAERALIPILEGTGVVVAVGRLIEWLGSDRLRAEHVSGATERLEKLVQRMQRWDDERLPAA